MPLGRLVLMGELPVGALAKRQVQRLMLILVAAILSANWTVTSPAPASAQDLPQDAVVSELHALDAAQDIAIEAKPSDDLNIYAMPIPIVDPTIGNGLALASLMTFRPDPTDRLSPRATLGFAAGYTDSNSMAAGSSLSMSLDRDRYRIDALGGYGSLNVKFYGIGEGGALQDNPLNFRLKGAFFSGSLTRRIAPHFYLGPTYKFLNSTSGFNPEAPPAGVTLPELQASLSGMGLTGEYDSRDSQFSPRKGIYATAQLIDFAQALGSDFSFLSFDGSASRYLTLSPKLVLASSLRIASAGGGAPFFALPFVSLRGFPGGKYLGENVWQGQAELRWNVYGPVGLVGFVGAGQAADSIGGFGQAKLLYAGGVGIRYMASEAERLNLGFDYAVGSDGGSAFYFRIGEAF